MGVTKIPLLRTYSFYLKNSQGRKVLFDLGARKDLHNLAPSVRHMLDTVEWEVKVDKNVFDILHENGYKGTDFEAIIWSHHHWDHIGDLAPFSSNVDLVVRPRLKDTYLPGHSNEDASPIPESDYSVRRMIKVDFNGPKSLKIGRLNAHDYFGNGSFYVLDTSGHSVGHLSAVVRTSLNPDTFVILGADAIHDTGELRPSQYLPIPEEVNIGHLSNPDQDIFCPDHAVQQFQISRSRKATEPLFNPTAGYNMVNVHSTIQMLQELDWNENFFLIYAHDDSIKGTVDELCAFSEINYRERMIWISFSASNQLED
ncbi:beta-lactamase-like protein [Aspergillus cavernicola]|uniref:Beta-lactamase-like protein n=1 Tax=Aspergillus cavernicola TaxID=176166 RepID=A0ABR4HQK2_9EURO